MLERDFPKVIRNLKSEDLNMEQDKQATNALKLKCLNVDNGFVKT